MTLNRRRFLGTGAAFAALPALGHASAAPPDLDVAIIGGGVAGTYAAWRLRQQRPHWRLRLFEASDHIGGRLHSVTFPQAPHLVVEAGGMRYLDAHTHVSRLVKRLDLKAREYPIDRAVNRMMLRGTNIPLAEVQAGRARFPYKVADKDQTPQADFFGKAVENVLPNATRMKWEDWLKVRKGYRFKGRRLQDWTNRDLLLQGMTTEQLALVQESSGYDDWIDGETGLDELDYFFVHDDESKPFRSVVGGYQRVPLMLAAQARLMGAGVSTNTCVVSLVSEHGANRLALRDAAGRQSEVTAARVILALPRRGIERIENFPDAKQNRRFSYLIASVRPIPACKSLLLYKRPWWRDHGLVEGRNITDMPARQFYMLGSETTRHPAEGTNGYGVLMAYCDMKSVANWKALVPNAHASGYSMLTGDSPLAAEVHREAQLVLGKTDLTPVAARFQDWTAEPHGGGWHYYALGHDGVEDSAAMLKPIEDRQIYVCGEAYSRSQGWVEGALERTETLLQRHFGLQAPRWL